MDLVQRSFQAEGYLRRAGEVLDVSGFKHASRLREQRYLAPFSGEYMECNLCDRKFADQEAFRLHIKQDHPDALQPGRKLIKEGNKDDKTKG